MIPQIRTPPLPGMTPDDGALCLPSPKSKALKARLAFARERAAHVRSLVELAKDYRAQGEPDLLQD